MISIDAAFLGDVGASITVPCTISVFSCCPLHLHKPRQLLLTTAKDTDEVAYVLLKWGLSGFSLSLSCSLKDSVSALAVGFPALLCLWYLPDTFCISPRLSVCAESSSLYCICLFPSVYTLIIV